MDTQKKTDDANIECVNGSQSELRQNEFKFKETYPGNEFSHLKERKHEVIPLVSMSEGSIYRIRELKMSSREPSTVVSEKRERYAQTVLTMFCHF